MKEQNNTQDLGRKSLLSDASVGHSSYCNYTDLWIPSLSGV